MRWFLAVVAILLIALILESGLLAYAMYVLLGLLAVSRWLARSGVDTIEAERVVRRAGKKDDEPETPESGLALEIGERVAVRVTVTNTGPVPLPWVLLEDHLPGGSLDARAPKLRVRGERRRIEMLRPGGEVTVKYTLECLTRGYHQVGPLVVETGDLFGLHRRFKIVAEPKFVLVYPRVVPLTGYDLASRRPIGDVRMTHKLFEDPTRIAGVRPYQQGDPLSRIHWGATARTGALHSKINEPSTLSGITVLLDFHADGYPKRGEPDRSELAVLAALALANAVYLMGQQVGFVTNARDAAERIRTEGWDKQPTNREDAAKSAEDVSEKRRLEPLIVETRRGVEQLQRIRETLARVEKSDGLTFAQLTFETAHRLPRDATVLAVLPVVTVETAIALGNLKRRGMAVACVLVLMFAGGLRVPMPRDSTTGTSVRSARAALAWPGVGQAALAIGDGEVQLSGVEQPVPIASLAKIMTAVVVLDAAPLEPGQDGFVVRVDRADVEDTELRRARSESVVELQDGEALTERQALSALLLPSANNVAHLLAVEVAGSEPAFTARMNARAQALGMRHTHYADASGFDQTSVSTAADQTSLARAAMRNPTFAWLVRQRSADLPSGPVASTDRLLDEGYLGIKTGSTSPAGGCFVFAVRRIVHGRDQLVFGAVTGQQGRDLLDAAFAATTRLVDSVAGA